MLMRTFLRPWVQKEKKENDQGAIKKKDYQVKGSIEVSCKQSLGYGGGSTSQQSIVKINRNSKHTNTATSYIGTTCIMSGIW